MARILVVDDTKFMRQQLRFLLQAHGHEVVDEAENGDEAVELYKQHRPDLVTLDLTMPGRNGDEVIRELLAADARAKIVIVSAVYSRSRIEDCLAMGALGFIPKPLTSIAVRNAVADVLAHKPREYEAVPTGTSESLEQELLTSINAFLVPHFETAPLVDTDTIDIVSSCLGKVEFESEKYLGTLVVGMNEGLFQNLLSLVHLVDIEHRVEYDRESCFLELLNIMAGKISADWGIQNQFGLIDSKPPVFISRSGCDQFVIQSIQGRHATLISGDKELQLAFYFFRKN
jgi:two-component system, chemotaxis family, chemotaxis protein CheY